MPAHRRHFSRQYQAVRFCYPENESVFNARRTSFIENYPSFHALRQYVENH